MSDERDDADAAADGGTDDTQGGRTAVVTRPQRPSGKRSRQRADIDDESSGAVELTESDADDKTAKKAKKAKKADDSSTNPIVYVITPLELRRR